MRRAANLLSKTDVANLLLGSETYHFCLMLPKCLSTSASVIRTLPPAFRIDILYSIEQILPHQTVFYRCHSFTFKSRAYVCVNGRHWEERSKSRPALDINTEINIALIESISQ